MERVTKGDVWSYVKKTLLDGIAKLAEERLSMYVAPDGADIKARGGQEAKQVLRFFSRDLLGDASQIDFEQIGRALYFAYDLFNAHEESDLDYVLATFGINGGYNAAAMGYAPLLKRDPNGLLPLGMWEYDFDDEDEPEEPETPQ